ncbi:MAG: gluconokinase [Firmicutes bacterium]|nr:gluconokinase [Bacillota bacterium]
MSKSPYIVTLDIGTSSVRAMLYDSAGEPVPGFSEVEQHRVIATPDGGNELEADGILERSVRCLERLCRREDFPAGEVAGVAGCTFWHSLVVVDGDSGEPLTPVYLWGDTRSREAIPLLRAKLDQDSFHARTGCFFHTSYLPAKIAWLFENNPEYKRSSVKLMSMAEYLFFKLFGQRVASYSMASGSGLMDQGRLAWDREVLEALSVDVDQLSLLVDKDEPITGLLPDYAARLPELANVPWFPPVGDGAADNIGSGCNSPRDVALMIGTSGATRVVATDPLPDAPDGIWFYRVDGKRYVVGGSLSNGGNVLQWLAQLVGKTSLEEYIPRLQELAPDSHGLTVLPFLAGERCPGWNPYATGAVIGLRMHTSDVQIMRAACEAVAYRFALIHELMKEFLPADYRVISTGGGLHRYPFWNQIIADVLNRPVALSDTREASSRGAALLALESLGFLNDVSVVRPKVKEVYEPGADNYRVYQAGLERHRRFYDLVKSFV